jgi:peptidoglycan/LPS O-acetylase OafA/YrhL
MLITQAPKQSVELKIHALTSSRFFAALFVVFFHVRWALTPGTLSWRFAAFGAVPVMFFFVLSGYILATVYLAQRGINSVPKYNFYLARFARIYPLYIASIVFAAPIAVHARVGKYGLFGALERSVVLVGVGGIMQQMWLPIWKVVNGPSWTLSVEAVFYFAFPFLAPHLWRLSRRASFLGLAVFYVIASVFSFLINQQHPEGNRRYGFHLLSYVLVFGIGILAARLESYHSGKRENPAWEMKSSVAWIVLAVSTLIFFLAIRLHEMQSLASWDFGILLTPVFVAIILVMARSSILAVRLLSIPPLVVLGEASYALYLLHYPIQHYFAWVGWDKAEYFLYFLALCIAISLVSFFYFETPVRTAILRKWKRQKQRLPETLEVASDV